MALGSIGGSSYGYYARLNMVKLEQALQKNTRYQESLQAVEGTQAVRPVDPVKPVSLQSDLNFLEKYTSSMVGVMQSANTLRFDNRGGIMNDLTVSSSDSEVADAVKRYALKNPKDLTVSVSQVAVAQQNVSQGVVSSIVATGDLDFSITDSKNQSVQIAVSNQREDGSARTNVEMLAEAARQVNDNSSLGVRASVVEKDGTVSLMLQAKETGEKNAFDVSVNSLGVMGLNQVRTSAQDAVYSVRDGKNSRNYESSSNDVTLEYGSIGLTLKSEGTTTISSHPDSKKVTEALGELVDSFNQAIGVLNQNRGRGTGVAMQQRSFQQGLAPAATLNRMGITANKDGTLTLDKATFEKRLQDEPGLTNQLIGGNFSVAQIAYNKADAALRTNADSLLNNQSRTIGMGNFTGTAQMVSSYAGLGLMIDYLI